MRTIPRRGRPLLQIMSILVFFAHSAKQVPENRTLLVLRVLVLFAGDPLLSRNASWLEIAGGASIIGYWPLLVVIAGWPLLLLVAISCCLKKWPRHYNWLFLAIAYGTSGLIIQ